MPSRSILRMLTRPVMLLPLGALVILVLTAVLLLDERPTPRLYTNDNSADVWEHPGSHLGARVDVTGPVEAVRKTDGGVLLAFRIGGKLAIAHIYDAGFRVRPRDSVHVIGAVRGPLGDVRQVPSVPVFAPLEAGVAAIDATSANVRQGPSLTRARSASSFQPR